jgi:hypothetical protein
MVRMSQLSGWKLQFFDRWPGAIGICLDLILAAALDCGKNGIAEIYESSAHKILLFGDCNV